MDLKNIEQLLKSEAELLEKSMWATLEEAISRRTKMYAQIVQELSVNFDSNLTDSEFFILIEALDQISGNISDVLNQAGFAFEVSSKWKNKIDAPPSEIRTSTMKLVLDAALRYYSHNRPIIDIGSLVSVATKIAMPTISRERVFRSRLLSRQLSTYEGYKNLASRVRNSLRNDNILTVGELAVMSEGGVLRIPNFGRKSLTETKIFLKELGLEFGCLSEAEMTEVQNRSALNSCAESPLETEWRGEVKPEYANLTKEERYNLQYRVSNRPDPEILFDRINADANLICALHEVGITCATELATAPQDVLMQICYDNASWLPQLTKLIENCRQLSLYMTVPPHLNENVRVFRHLER